jgi:hypothetical protein
MSLDDLPPIIGFLKNLAIPLPWHPGTLAPWHLGTVRERIMRVSGMDTLRLLMAGRLG